MSPTRFMLKPCRYGLAVTAKSKMAPTAMVVTLIPMPGMSITSSDCVNGGHLQANGSRHPRRSNGKGGFVAWHALAVCRSEQPCQLAPLICARRFGECTPARTGRARQPPPWPSLSFSGADGCQRAWAWPRRPEDIGAAIGAEGVALTVAPDRHRRVCRLDLHAAHRVAGVAIACTESRPVAVQPVQDAEHGEEDQVEIRGVVPREVGRGDRDRPEVGTSPAARKSNSVSSPAVDMSAQKTISMRTMSESRNSGGRSRGGGTR